MPVDLQNEEADWIKVSLGTCIARPLRVREPHLNKIANDSEYHQVVLQSQKKWRARHSDYEQRRRDRNSECNRHIGFENVVQVATTVDTFVIGSLGTHAAAPNCAREVAPRCP